MIENINCISFKRDCGAEPQAVVARPQLLGHQQACSACAAFYQSMLALDTMMMGALALPVGENSLDEQLSRAHKAATNISFFSKFKPTRVKLAFAAAASVFVAAFSFIAPQYSTTAFAGEVVDHIYHEPHLLTLTEAITDGEKIRMVLKHANVVLSGSDVEVLSAQLCPVSGQLAAHLVVRGTSGDMVTILIFPDVDTPAGKIKSKEFNGRILSAEHGAIAVVGGKRENLDHMEQVALEAFHWLD